MSRAAVLWPHLNCPFPVLAYREAAQSRRVLSSAVCTAVHMHNVGMCYPTQCHALIAARSSCNESRSCAVASS
jgi:hypothetical protein